MRTLPWAVLAVLLVLLLCHAWFGPDIWFHLYLGGRIAETFQPQPPDRLLLHQASFLNLYWLFQLTVRAAYAAGGIYGVSILFMVVWAVALVFWARTARVLHAGGWGPFVALFALLVCQNRFEARPEIFSYAFLAMQICWLDAWRLAERPAKWEFARFAAVEALWCNMHGYFVFGPLLVGLKLAGWIPDCRRIGSPAKGQAAGFQPGWLALWPLLGITIFASFASPFGVRNWAEVAYLQNFLDRMHTQIQEFLPVTGVGPLQLWTVKLFWCYWGAVAIAGVYALAARTRADLFALGLAAVGLVLSPGAFRNIPMAVFFSAPLLGLILPRLAAWVLPERSSAVAAMAAGVALCAWVASGGYQRSTHSPGGFGIRESEYAYPIRFAEYLRETGFSGRIFNQSSDGGYLEFHFPNLELYGDSRFVDSKLVRGYFAAIRDPRAFHILDRRFDFDGALLPVIVSRGVIEDLMRDPEWRLVYADLHRGFFASLRSPIGAAAPVREPRFYRGEDLASSEYGVPAHEWIALFAEINDRRDLVLALTQFLEAPRVPMPVFEAALDYARQNRDTEIISDLRAARPKLIVETPTDGENVDRLLR